jgi:hypothetical protein
VPSLRGGGARARCAATVVSRVARTSPRRRRSGNVRPLYASGAGAQRLQMGTRGRHDERARRGYRILICASYRPGAGRYGVTAAPRSRASARRL